MFKLKACDVIPHNNTHNDEVLAVNEKNEEALVFCPETRQSRWIPYTPEYKQSQLAATPKALFLDTTQRVLISPDGKIHKCPATHYEYILEHPDLFKSFGKLDEDYILEAPERYDRLITKIINAGWIRGYILGKILTIEAVNLSTAHRAEDYIFQHLKEISNIELTTATRSYACSAKDFAERDWDAFSISSKGRISKRIEEKGYFCKEYEVEHNREVKGAAEVQVVMPKKEFVKEHEKLVKELENPKPEELKRERKEQNKELQEVKKASGELIREIHKATDQYNYEATEYNLTNGTLKKNQVIPLKETHVRLTDPTKSRYEMYAGNGEWRLLSAEEFAKWKAEWDEINKTNYGKKEASLKIVAYIVHEGGKWCVKAHSGRNLGCYETKAEAEKRLAQVEMFKHMKSSKQLASVKFSTLEELKTKCPDCYAKFEKFAKEKGVHVSIKKEAKHVFKVGDEVKLIKNWDKALEDMFGSGAKAWDEDVSKAVLANPTSIDLDKYTEAVMRVERLSNIAVDYEGTQYPEYVDTVVINGVDIPEFILEPAQAEKEASEPSGIGYGGDREGIAVAPKRDEDVSLESKKAALDPTPLLDQINLIKTRIQTVKDRLQTAGAQKTAEQAAEDTSAELIKWIESDLDMILKAYKDRPDVVAHIKDIESEVAELEKKFILEHKAGYGDYNPDTKYICPECKKPTVEHGSLGWRECENCSWKEGPQPEELIKYEDPEEKESSLHKALLKKLAAHYQKGDAYVIRFLEKFDYEYEKEVQAILNNGKSVDDRFEALKALIPQLMDNLISEKDVQIKHVDWSDIVIDPQDIMKVIEEHDEFTEPEVEKESAYRTPRPTTPPPQGFNWAYDPPSGQWELVATQ